ncbi:MAG: GAF domain-containing protein [Rhodospirillales bacterium]|nr:GAF domain-containing protein [Acetobacter sp.]
MATQLPVFEQTRLAELASLDILDTPPEPEFNAIVVEAASALQVPIAALTLLNCHRQWFKAQLNVGIVEAPRAPAFSNYLLHENAPLIVLDAAQDPRFSTNPYVTGAPFVRFYAGVPLVTWRGHHIGALSVADTQARSAKPGGLAKLSELAQTAAALMEERRLQKQMASTLALS